MPEVFFGLDDEEIQVLSVQEKKIREQWEKNGIELGELIDFQYDPDADQYGLLFSNDDNWYY